MNIFKINQRLVRHYEFWQQRCKDMNQKEFWNLTGKAGQIVASANHDGHELRDEVSEIIKLSSVDRLREEDPYTGEWTSVADTKIIVSRSRFEVDINRPRDKAVYQKPEDAWGLNIWKRELPQDIISRSLIEYDLFYKEVYEIFSNLEKHFGHFVVLDLHTYNHMRNGADGEPADPELNPEVNIGTGTMNRSKWANLIDRFISDLHNFDYYGRKLDVRENIKFKGGQFSKWIHQTFPESACSISIEFKKFFMDEWSGKPDVKQIERIGMALKSTIPGMLEELNRIK